MSREALAAQQQALVASLVAGAPPPPGFDPDRLALARAALLNKRSGEVARHWRDLAQALGPQWRPRFGAWARDRPPLGGLRDGFDFARHLAARGELPAAACPELTAREGFWVYDGVRPPRPRRWPAPLRRLYGRLKTLRY